MATQAHIMDAVIEKHAMTAFRRLVGEEEFDFDLDALFRFGLERLLDGVAVLVSQASLTRPRQRS